MKKRRIVIISGEIETGKTNLCQDLLQRAKEVGVNVAGLISPAVFAEGKKTGIDVINIKTGERKPLADLRDLKRTDLETKRWSFHKETLEWGNQALKDAVPCDLLIIDELGPLEFTQEEGLVNGLKVLDRGDFQLAIVVIRPSLVDIASSRWQAIQIINISEPEGVDLTASELFINLGIKDIVTN